MTHLDTVCCVKSAHILVCAYMCVCVSCLLFHSLTNLICCPGMIKLLQRLPDSSREEVRNQAIVLIQQLTSNNEEMKKTVVFNEVLS